MSNISIDNTNLQTIEFSVEKSVVEATEMVNSISVVENMCTLTADSSVTLVSTESLVVNLEVYSISPTISVDNVIQKIEVITSETDVIEKCLQGPPGAIGPAGSGGSSINGVVDIGQTEVVSSLSTLNFSAANWRLNIKNFVLNRQKIVNIDSIFLPGHDIRYSIHGINSKDTINYNLSITRNGNNIELTIQNLMPSSLIIDGLLFPIV